MVCLGDKWPKWIQFGFKQPCGQTWELIQHEIWVNYNELTATSLGIMVSKGNHPQMALIKVSEIL